MIIMTPGKFIEVPAGLETSLEGRFILSTAQANADGNPIEATRVIRAEFGNLITNQGLNRIGSTGNFHTHIHVGAGTAVPQFTDTGLQSFVASTSTIQAQTTTAQASAPFFGQTSITRRFAAGVAAGNLTEIGVGWGPTGSVLFSRALILDGLGAPTAISVQPTEVLDATYILRCFAPVGDVLGNINVAGVGNIATTTRAAHVTSASLWGMSNVQGGISFNHPWVNALHNGVIGAVTGSPTGASEGAESVTNFAYANNSFFREATVFYGLNSANLAGGATAAHFRLGATDGFGVVQMGFGTAIPKNNTRTLSLLARHTWARRTL